MDEYIGIIKSFAGNFAPRGWMFCDGSLLPIAQYQALFAIIGTTYGGNGTTNFALPDLRGRVALGYNAGSPGPGLSNYALGQQGGTETVTLMTTQIPPHNHLMVVTTANASQSTATSGSSFIATPGSLSGRTFTPSLGFDNAGTNLTPLATQSVSYTGGGQPHQNMQPYLAVSMIICVEGIFPSRP